MVFLLAPLASAHVVFAPPRSYAIPGRAAALDLSPQKDTYLALGAASYGEAVSRARTMQAAIAAFIDAPSAKRQDAARTAWIEARKAYTETEIFRFNDGPIDAPPTTERAAGPEGRINMWPVDESTIDYVAGHPKAGLIQEFDTPLTITAILVRDQVGDESAVTTGWHAIEFLLWGQDLRRDGPGNRSYRDYLGNGPANTRRRQYLQLVTDQLIADLGEVARQWQVDEAGTYRTQLLATPAIEVLGRALHGATSYLTIELFGERLSVALDSGSQEDEHSCFSDTTHLDLQHGIAGVANLLRGDFGERHLGPGIIEVIAFQNPALAARVNKALTNAITQAAALKPPIDQLIRMPPEHPDRIQAEATVTAFHELALSMKASAEALGIQIVVPGV
jgi:putative iron-regulated protein